MGLYQFKWFAKHISIKAIQLDSSIFRKLILLFATPDFSWLFENLIPLTNDTILTKTRCLAWAQSCEEDWWCPCVGSAQSSAAHMQRMLVAPDLRQHMSCTAKDTIAHLQKSQGSCLSPESYFGYESRFSHTTSLSKGSLGASMITMDAKAHMFIYSLLYVCCHSVNTSWTLTLRREAL